MASKRKVVTLYRIVYTKGGQLHAQAADAYDRPKSWKFVDPTVRWGLNPVIWKPEGDDAHSIYRDWHLSELAAWSCYAASWLAAERMRMDNARYARRRAEEGTQALLAFLRAGGE